ncbi:MAG: hypothetical protein EAZ92_14985 [Candidatus Kapaibacterium sp.]|nr:MAG: hypothetical protein EAZ92_14985 [Candidatus Kapabacteria bacterium]
MKNINPQELESALARLPRLPYDEWLRVVSGIANHFGEEQAREILRHGGFHDERRNETEYKIRKRLRGITIGTVIHILRQYGIEFRLLSSEYSSEVRGQSFGCLPAMHSNSHEYLPQSLREPCIHKFYDEEAEERVSFYQYQAGCNRYDAERKVVQEFSNVDAERLYRCAVNTNANNKNVLCSYGNFLDSFQQTALRFEQLKDVIKQGFTIAPFLFLERKNQANWLGAELVFIDVDSGLNVYDAIQMDATQQCLFLYTSPSHTEEQHRYRVVFALSSFERSINAYRRILEKFIELYKADSSCSDPAKHYFGNTNAIFWQPKEGFVA